MYEITVNIHETGIERIDFKILRIEKASETAARAGMVIGKELNELKEISPHESLGLKNFYEFVEAYIGFKKAQACKLMKIAREFSYDNETVAQYSASQLVELSTKGVDQDRLIEMANDGEISPEMTAKEIRKLFKPETQPETQPETRHEADIIKDVEKELTKLVKKYGKDTIEEIWRRMYNE